MNNENMLTVIIIEETFLLRRNLRTAIENMGHIVYGARDGLEGLKIISKKDINPDLIIIDLDLPGMNGWKVIDKIRLSNKYEDLPISIIAAVKNKSIENEAKKLNIIHVLEKPFQDKDIKSIINQAALISPIRHEKLKEKNKLIQNKKNKILICDNSKFTVNMIEQILKKYNYSTITITSPLLILGDNEKNGILYNKKINLIITDINMPEINGYELAEKIKTNNKFKNIPIIAVSANTPEKSSQNSKPIFDAYILKPINMRPETHIKLIQSIENLLNKKKL